MIPHMIPSNPVDPRIHYVALDFRHRQILMVRRPTAWELFPGLTLRSDFGVAVSGNKVNSVIIARRIQIVGSFTKKGTRSLYSPVSE